jgi:hypothetical protein
VNHAPSMLRLAWDISHGHSRYFVGHGAKDRTAS